MSVFLPEDMTWLGLIGTVLFGVIVGLLFFLLTTYKTFDSETLAIEPPKSDSAPESHQKGDFRLIGRGISKYALKDVLIGSKITPEIIETLGKDFETAWKDKMDPYAFQKASITVSVYTPIPATPQEALKNPIKIPSKAIIQINPGISDLLAEALWKNLDENDRPAKIQTKSPPPQTKSTPSRTNSSSPKVTPESKSTKKFELLSNVTKNGFIAIRIKSYENSRQGAFTKVKVHIFPNLFYIVSKALEYVDVDIPPSRLPKVSRLKVGNIDNIRFENSNSSISVDLCEPKRKKIAMITVKPCLEQLFTEAHKGSFPVSKSPSLEEHDPDNNKPTPTPSNYLKLELAPSDQIKPSDLGKILSHHGESPSMKTIIILTRRGGNGPGYQFFSSNIIWEWSPAVDKLISEASEKEDPSSKPSDAEVTISDDTSASYFFMDGENWLENFPDSALSAEDI